MVMMFGFQMAGMVAGFHIGDGRESATSTIPSKNFALLWKDHGKDVALLR